MCVSVFLKMGRGGRAGSAVWEGGRWDPFSLGPRPASPYLLRHWDWGLGEDWELQTEDFWALRISSWTLHPTGEKEKDLVFLCVSEVPSRERGDVGLVALCNNQIPLFMFNNWVFALHQFLFVFWPTFGQATKNNQGIKEHEIETDIPNLNHWNYSLAYISHCQNRHYHKKPLVHVDNLTQWVIKLSPCPYTHL